MLGFSPEVAATLIAPRTWVVSPAFARYIETGGHLSGLEVRLLRAFRIEGVEHLLRQHLSKIPNLSVRLGHPTCVLV